jgi:hypothetical protein
MRSAAFHTFIGLGILTGLAFAQGPVGDEIVVTLDRAAMVGSHTLNAGEYTIRQVTSASNPRVLQFTSDHGTKLEATVTAIPIFQTIPAAENRVVLDNEGATPRLDRIWIQGKNYGYEFPGKAMAGATAASTDTGLRMEARFDVPPAQPAAEVARNEPAPAPAPAPREEPAAPAPEPTSQAAPAQPEQTPPAAEPAPATLPQTSLGLGNVLLTGLALLAIAGILSIRRRA